MTTTNPPPAAETRTLLVPRSTLLEIQDALQRIEAAPAWGAPDKWETTPAEVRLLARDRLRLVVEALAAPDDITCAGASPRREELARIIDPNSVWVGCSFQSKAQKTALAKADAILARLPARPEPVVDAEDEQPGDYLRDRLRNIADICEAKGLLVEASGLRDTANIVSEQFRKAFGAEQ